MLSRLFKYLAQIIDIACNGPLFTNARAQIFDLSAQLALPATQTRLEKYSPQATVHLEADIHTLVCLHDDFADKSVALYVHWSPTGKVSRAVCYAVQHLASLGYEIIFISGNTKIHYTDSLSQHCSAILTRSCTGYDFTSWKAAFERFPSLYNAKECLLINDSIFFPIGSAAPIHEAMAKVPCDFWGLTASLTPCPHLQSFYLVFRQKALQHPCFAKFINAINTNADREYCIEAYELTLTIWLATHGLVPAAYIPLAARRRHKKDAPQAYWQWFIEEAHVPILKRNIPSIHPLKFYRRAWRKIVQAQGYDPKLIEEALKERKETKSANITSP